MPRTNRPPSYRLHKARDLAVVTIDGKNHYLGPYGSPESHENYARLIAQWKSRMGPSRETIDNSAPGSRGLSVNALILAYWRHVESYYVKNGRPTSEQDNIRQALRFVRKLYGSRPIEEFGPIALKRVRDAMIEAGRSRKLINKDVHRIRGLFKWAVAEEIYPGTLLVALSAVGALKKGRSAAKEAPPVAPVPEETVLATLPHLSAQVAAMVQLQLLSAARPGEVAVVRPCDVDRSDPCCWLYRPGYHKTEHRGRERVIAFGPRAQEVLRPWLERDPEAYCFSPAQVVACRAVRDPSAPSARRASKRSPSRPEPGGCYTKDSYRVAIARACRRAFPHPEISQIRPKDRTSEQKAALKEWNRQHAWHPHQLRHTRATSIRHAYDLEAAQVILGHATPDTTLIYAERCIAKAKEVMARIG